MWRHPDQNAFCFNYFPFLAVVSSDHTILLKTSQSLVLKHKNMEDIQRTESAAMLKKRVKMPTTTTEKLEVARELKEQGNSRVKVREYKKAIFSYSKVFLYTQGLPGRKKLNPERDPKHDKA